MTITSSHSGDHGDGPRKSFGDQLVLDGIDVVQDPDAVRAVIGVTGQFSAGGCPGSRRS